MRILLSICIMLLSVATLHSQTRNVVGAEWFWDSDPGQGNATALSAIDGLFDEAMEEVLSAAQSSPPIGIHTLNIRVLSDDGLWSPLFTTVINSKSPILAMRDFNIIQAEYFWDADPGVGNGSPLLALDGQLDEAMESVIAASQSTPSIGPHTLGIRVMGDDGSWGPTFQTVINSKQSVLNTRDFNITQAEYFWDVDPGEGNGTPLLAHDGQLDEALEAMIASSQASPSLGIHTLGIRVIGDDGSWSPTFISVLNTLDALVDTREFRITEAEFFIDTDPGEGYAIPMLAFDGNYNDALETALAEIEISQTVDVHQLGIRALGDDGTWSPVFRVNFESRTPLVDIRDVNITQAEYFWDTDPGEGNGLPMLAIDGNLDRSIEAVTASQEDLAVDLGVHLLGIKVRSSDGNWSPIHRAVIDVKEPTVETRKVMVKGAEYYFDTDPGEGNATPIFAQDGDFCDLFEVLVGGDIPTPVDAGIHALYIRTFDDDDNWGPSFGIVVNIDTTMAVPPFITYMQGATKICDGDLPGSHTYTIDDNVDTEKTWTIIGGVILSGQGTSSVEVSFTGYAPHSISVVECNDDGHCDDFTIDITVPVNTRADITGDGTVNVDDFLALNSSFGITCGVCPEDINEDGQVNVDDFLELNTFFGTACDL